MPKSIAGGSGNCAVDTTGATKHLAASYKMPIRGIEYRKHEALAQPESCISEHRSPTAKRSLNQLPLMALEMNRFSKSGKESASVDSFLA
ncbi:hypothetical protein MUO83_03055 [Candidatus Bathyarchaeota archaeon]|nr:hypothetical protein [Candidatus Bathyarchaeota archaeon]